MSCISDRGLVEHFMQRLEKNSLADESEPDARCLSEIPEDIRDFHELLFHLGLLAQQTWLRTR